MKNMILLHSSNLVRIAEAGRRSLTPFPLSFTLCKMLS